MADFLSKETRSKVMACVKGAGNKATELALIRLFRIYRISGWRRKQRVYGKPDFVFKKERVAVFVDGCFWHGCHSHCRMPKSRLDYWYIKIDRNIQRDKQVNKNLIAKGWKVLRIWEHSLNSPKSFIPKINLMLGRS
jgi:DNA mismatch endonuclease (patch repair protein)